MFFNNLKELESLLTKAGIDTTVTLSIPPSPGKPETKVHYLDGIWHDCGCLLFPSNNAQPAPSLKDLAEKSSKLCFCAKWESDQVDLHSLLSANNYLGNEKMKEITPVAVDQANRYPAAVSETLIETAKTRFLISKVRYREDSLWLNPLKDHLKKLEASNSVNLTGCEDQMKYWCTEALVEEIRTSYFHLGSYSETLVEALDEGILTTLREQFKNERKFLTILYPHYNDLLWDVYRQGENLCLIPEAVLFYLAKREYLKKEEYYEIEETPSRELLEIADQLYRDNPERSVKWLYQSAKALT